MTAHIKPIEFYILKSTLLATDYRTYTIDYIMYTITIGG